jgi:hypothetical protein
MRPAYCIIIFFHGAKMSRKTAWVEPGYFITLYPGISNVCGHTIQSLMRTHQGIGLTCHCLIPLVFRLYDAGIPRGRPGRSLHRAMRKHGLLKIRSYYSIPCVWLRGTLVFQDPGGKRFHCCGECPAVDIAFNCYCRRDKMHTFLFQPGLYRCDRTL